MEKVNGIEIREVADLGPVIARADHEDRAIEVNARIFYGLPPMVQEFVLCHEVCHLKYNEHDESATNALAAQLFLERAQGDDDLAARRDFISWLDGRVAEGYSNWWQAVIAAIPSAVSLGYTIYGIIKDQNKGWYSWERATQQANLKVMLTQAFEESRKSSERSASDFFWDILYKYDNRDGSTDQFLARSENAWVKKEIAKYEKEYGFGFSDVTPIDWLAYPAVKIAIVALVGLLVFLLVRKIIKNRK